MKDPLYQQPWSARKDDRSAESGDELASDVKISGIIERTSWRKTAEHVIDEETDCPEKNRGSFLYAKLFILLPGGAKGGTASKAKDIDKKEENQ